MYRLCFPSCAHDMFLPTGSMPARTRDESKLHTSFTADAASSPHRPGLLPRHDLWSTMGDSLRPSSCGGPTTQRVGGRCGTRGPRHPWRCWEPHRHQGHAPQGSAPEVRAALVPLLSKREPALSQNETAGAQRSQATCTAHAGVIHEKRTHRGRVDLRSPPASAPWAGSQGATGAQARALLWHTSCSYS
jgi:hypothetical protein